MAGHELVLCNVIWIDNPLQYVIPHQKIGNELVNT